ncbi:MAG: 4Fe-4S binding protein [Phycisphaeraceae bacterium]
MTPDSLRIAIASGKGGTGKTTLAACLATLAARRGADVTYVDCDVEAPNGHLLLDPALAGCEPVTRLVPRVDLSRCSRCGLCAQLCQFGAILLLPGGPQMNPGLCKSCGLCAAVCPDGALAEVPHRVGEIRTGTAGPVRFVQGVLDVGQARAPAVIEAARQRAEDGGGLVLIDAPPGASCPMVAAVQRVDLALLVADPTPFGLADLAMAAQALRGLSVPAAVVINRSDLGGERARSLAAREGLPVLGELPDSGRVARAYAAGRLEEIVRELAGSLEPVLERIFCDERVAS